MLLFRRLPKSCISCCNPDKVALIRIISYAYAVTGRNCFSCEFGKKYKIKSKELKKKKFLAQIQALRLFRKFEDK